MVLRYVQELALAVIKQVSQEYVSGTSAMAREAKKFFLSQDFDFWAELANSNLSGEVMIKRLEPLRERNKQNWKATEPKECIVCGKQFVPKCSKQITCSVKCAQVRKSKKQKAWREKCE